MPSTLFIGIIVGLVAIVLVAMLWALISITTVVKANMAGINKLVYDVDVKLQNILEQTTVSIQNLNSISSKVDGQMDRVEMIIENAETITDDIRITTKTVQTTVVPIMVGVLSLMQGVKAGYKALRQPALPEEGIGHGTD